MTEIYTEPRLTDFVARPDYGVIGRAIEVRTNFFEITSLPQSSIIHYDVTISPDVPPVINRKVYEEFETHQRNGALNGLKPVFDGMIFFSILMKLITKSRVLSYIFFCCLRVYLLLNSY